MSDTGSGPGDERPEIGELLSGLDPPRSLPESLRQRLEDELSAGAPARPLDPDLDDRLMAALGSREDQDMAMLFSGLDGPRPLPASLSSRLRDQLGDQLAPRRGRIALMARKGARAQIGAGVAAVSLLVAAVTGIALSSHNPSRPAATAPSTSAAISSGAAGTPASGNGAASGGAVAATRGSGTATGGVPLAAPNDFSASNAGVSAGATGSTSNQGSSSPVNDGPAAAPPLVGPQVDSVVPARGSPIGGTTVTIRGLRFDGATAVHFGTMAALNFVVQSGGQIMAISPPHLPGSVNVTVTTPHGTSAVTAGDRYDYTA